MRVRAEAGAMLDRAIETLDARGRAPHPAAHFAFADGSVRPIGVKLSQAALVS